MRRTQSHFTNAHGPTKISQGPVVVHLTREYNANIVQIARHDRPLVPTGRLQNVQNTQVQIQSIFQISTVLAIKGQAPQGVGQSQLMILVFLWLWV